jgi:integrase
MAKIKFTAGRVAEFSCAGTSAAFLWDAGAPGMGLRVTPAGSKSYIYQGKLRGQVIRLTIGSPDVWDLSMARAEANRLRVLIDQGLDPRQVKKDALSAAEAEREARAALEQKALAAARIEAQRQSVTLYMAWTDYVTERTPFWGERHAAEHVKMIDMGGKPRSRSRSSTTIAGPLATFANLPLTQLDSTMIERWAVQEATKRPTRARLAWRMLKAFLTWCSTHPTYGDLVDANAAGGKRVRERIGKPAVKDDVLQREQLPAWFAAVKQLSNPVVSSYLQCLLLSGARREELARLRWDDVDFRWKSMTIRDKIEGTRTIPLPPYMDKLISGLPRTNKWVFSSMTSASGRISDPTKAHKGACSMAGLSVSLHGLRRSFATLSEWVEVPAGVAADIQGHKPQGVREKNYIRRPLDLLRLWHVRIEAWMLEQANLQTP